MVCCVRRKYNDKFEYAVDDEKCWKSQWRWSLVSSVQSFSIKNLLLWISLVSCTVTVTVDVDVDGDVADTPEFGFVFICLYY